MDKVYGMENGGAKMRVALSVLNPVKDCQCSAQRDENEVSAHILAYQIAYHLLSCIPGQIQIDGSNLTLKLEEHESLHFDLQSGYLHGQNLKIPFIEGYKDQKRLDEIVKAIKEELMITSSHEAREVDPITTLLVKLIEIYHARCGLKIYTRINEDGQTTWEINLHEGGPSGWVEGDGTIRNRLGEVVRLEEWSHLRPEKRATYVFGFNRFCRHFPSPLDKETV